MGEGSERGWGVVFLLFFFFILFPPLKKMRFHSVGGCTVPNRETGTGNDCYHRPKKKRKGKEKQTHIRPSGSLRSVYRFQARGENSYLCLRLAKFSSPRPATLSKATLAAASLASRPLLHLRFPSLPPVGCPCPAFLPALLSQTSNTASQFRTYAWRGEGGETEASAVRSGSHHI